MCILKKKEQPVVEQTPEPQPVVEEHPKQEIKVLDTKSPITIILGTAHLISTPGKCSPDKALREYKYSREICIEVQKALTELGYRCIIDWIDDDMPNSKKELENRCEIVNNICKERGSKNCLYVSIHNNAAGNDGKWKEAYGWSVWVYRNGSENSRRLANCLFDEVKKLGLRTRQELPNKKYYDCGFYVLKHTKCPAVLTENFFQDCLKECDFLLSEAGKRAIVTIHVNGIINYLKTM